MCQNICFSADVERPQPLKPTVCQDWKHAFYVGHNKHFNSINPGLALSRDE